MTSKTNGIQLLGELSGCDADMLDDVEQLAELVERGVSECGLHQVSICSKKFEPIGVTVISLVSESHVSIHTYPESNHASIDIFHCSTEPTALLKLLEFFKAALHAEGCRHLLVARGDSLQLIP